MYVITKNSTLGFPVFFNFTRDEKDLICSSDILETCVKYTKEEMERLCKDKAEILSVKGVTFKKVKLILVD
jgi:hypothetical protein